MKTPFKFELNAEMPSGVLTRRKPRSTSRYRIAYAKTKLICYKPIKIFRQTFSGFAFYVERITHFVKLPTILSINVVQDSIVFIYNLTDDLNISIREQPEVMVIAKGHCFVHNIPAGKYEWHASPGKKSFICFGLRPHWLLKMRDDYPRLAEIAEQMVGGKFRNSVLPPYMITRYTARQLEKLQYCKAHGTVNLEENLLHIINNLVAEYHDHLLAPTVIPYKSPGQIVYEARDRIIEQVGDGVIPSVTNVSAQFNIEPKALRRICLKIFRMSTQGLILDAQMKRAYVLLKKGYKVKEVSNSLGYSEHANFSRSFKRFFGRPPHLFSQDILGNS